MAGGGNPFGKLFGGGAKGGLFGGTPAPTVADFTKRKWSQPRDIMGRGEQQIVGLSPVGGPHSGGSNPHSDNLIYRIKPKVGPATYDKVGHMEAQKQWEYREDMRNRKLAKMKELMDYGAKDLNQKVSGRRPGATPEARSLVDSPMMPANPAVDIMDPEIKSARARERKRYGRRYG